MLQGTTDRRDEPQVRILQAAIPALLVLVLVLAPSRPAIAQDAPLVGQRFFAIENLDRGRIDRRGVAGNIGNVLSQTVLAPNTRYRLWVFHPASNKIGRSEFATSGAGSSLQLGNINLLPFPALDHDKDGLADLAETIIGTSPENADTDGDGVADGAEVQQGSDPLDGFPVRTGIIAAVALPGEALDLSVSDDLLVAAHDTGVTGFNVFTGLTPAILFERDLPGSAKRVACAERRAVAALGDGGLALLDARDLADVETVAVVPAWELGGESVDAVAIADGVAYAGLENGRIVAVSAETGETLDFIPDAGDPIRDLLIHRGVLVALTQDALHTIELFPAAFRIVASTSGDSGGALPTNYRRLVGGGEMLHVVDFQGVDTFDVAADPLHPVLVRESETQSFWIDMAHNGTGVALACTSTTSLLTSAEVDAYLMPDPPAAIEFAGGIPTPGNARAVEIANGLLYVADGTSGLVVINYLAFDTNGVPPTVALEPQFSTKGVERNARVEVRATAGDDVQIRSVEFLVDGAGTTDASFPFAHRFRVTGDLEATNVTLRVRAFDTGGSSAWSDAISVPLLDDATGPLAIGVSPQGAAIAPVNEVTVLFDEEMDAATVVPSLLALEPFGPDRVNGTADDGAAIAPIAATYFAAGLRAQFEFAPLGLGLYRATLAASATDVAGNSLQSGRIWYFFIHANVDVDGDGVLDGAEDFDGDQIANAFEAALGLDPLISDADPAADADADGLTDLVELGLGTDPFGADTDLDGFSDSDDLLLGGDPLDPGRLPLTTATGCFSVRNDHFDVTAAHGPFSVRNDLPPVRDEAGPVVFSVENEGGP